MCCRHRLDPFLTNLLCKNPLLDSPKSAVSVRNFFLLVSLILRPKLFDVFLIPLRAKRQISKRIPCKMPCLKALLMRALGAASSIQSPRLDKAIPGVVTSLTPPPNWEAASACDLLGKPLVLLVVPLVEQIRHDDSDAAVSSAVVLTALRATCAVVAAERRVRHPNVVAIPTPPFHLLLVS